MFDIVQTLRLFFQAPYGHHHILYKIKPIIFGNFRITIKGNYSNKCKFYDLFNNCLNIRYRLDQGLYVPEEIDYSLSNIFDEAVVI